MSSNGLSFTATGEIAGLQRAATAMGFQNTVLFASGVVAPIAFAAVVSWAGWPAGFLLLGVLAIAGWVVLRPLQAQESAGWRARQAVTM
jgi:MFS family permease